LKFKLSLSLFGTERKLIQLCSGLVPCGVVLAHQREEVLAVAGAISRGQAPNEAPPQTDEVYVL
jgi:hypothetical protein